MGYDALIPLTRHGATGWATVNSPRGIIRQDMMILLMTSPGERIMNPDFGVGLRRYLFQPLVRSTLGAIENRIRTQVATYLPFVNIKEISFSSALDSGPGTVVTDMDPHTLSVSISYSFGRGFVDEITVSP